MITINNLNKYYNKGKSNEIHVINNTSLKFDDKGLVCLLGPSGCGKTTLLNVIGGLDTADSGTIAYDGLVLSKKKKDEFRAKDVGFVFQNYILLPDKTVYENLELVLNMFNLTKKEISERIDYALKAVNMENYQRRLTRQLSGGQMQRIAIARSLVKSPKLIIADEPTGNLDEKNTTQIMSIIKKLSKECLVVMVTHEKRLASFYSDRIIEILDGKIVSDISNDQKSNLVAKDDVNIYLGDLNSSEYLDSSNTCLIKYFYSSDKPKLKLDIVYRNDTIFFKASSDDPKIKFKLLDSNSETLIVDGKKPELKIEDVIENDYSMPKINKDNVRRSVISFKEAMKSAFSYLNGIRIKQKLMLLVFFVSAILIVISVGFMGKATYNSEYSFMVSSRNAIIYYEDVDERKLYEFEQKYDMPFVLPNAHPFFTTIVFDLYNQGKTNANNSIPSYTTLPSSYLEESDLICGRMPVNKNEIVVDKWIINYIDVNSNGILTQAGFTDFNQLLDKDLYSYYNYKYDISFSDESESLFNEYIVDLNQYTIVGISNINDSVCFTYENETILRMINMFRKQEIAPFTYVYYDSLEVRDLLYENDNQTYYAYKGLKDLNVTEYVDLDGNTCKISDATFGNHDILISKDTKLIDDYQLIKNGIKYNIVGYIDEKYTIAASDDTLKSMYYEILSGIDSCVLYSTSRDELITSLKGQKHYDLYEENLKYFRNLNNVQTSVFLVFTITFAAVALLFLYFTIRSSLISRVYEIGVYRSLGVRKTDIFRLFACEIFVLLCFSSFIGYIVSSTIITRYISVSLMPLIYYQWFSWLISLGIIIGINFLVGLLPVLLLLRLTPAEIISKYDI